MAKNAIRSTLGFILSVGILATALPTLGRTYEDLVRLRSRYEALEKNFSQLLTSYLTLFRGLDDVDRETRIIDIANVAEGRLTTESGVALSTTNRANQGTIYYTPYKGANISVFNGTNWTVSTFTERSITLSGLTGGKNYDVFIYHNGTTLALELSAAWASDIARTDALVAQDGVWVKSGATTRRLVGTIRATAATQTQDSASQRFVWNYQNRLPRYLQINDATNNWAYVTNGWRPARNQTTNKVEFVFGDDDNTVEASVLALINGSAANQRYFSTGVGLDTTVNISSQIRGSGTATTFTHQVWGDYVGSVPKGYHWLQWMERSSGASVTVYGDNGDATAFQSGVLGEISG